MTVKELKEALDGIPEDTKVSVMGADRPVVVLVTNRAEDYVLLEERAKTFVEAYEIETPKQLAEYRILHGSVQI